MRRTSELGLAVVLCATTLGGLALAQKGPKPKVHVFEHRVSSASGGRLGAEVHDMSEALRKALGGPAGAGVLVHRVRPDSAGAKAGLAAGDVIVEVDGKRVGEPADVLGALAGKKPGDVVKLSVVRDKKPLALTATLQKGAPRAHGFDFDVDAEAFQFDFDWPDGMGKGMGMAGIAFPDTEELEKQLDATRARVKELEERLEKLEKRGK